MTKEFAAQSLELIAPAKLNLFLHIIGRRADGYHSLQTLFELIDLADTLNFSLDAPVGEILIEPDVEGVALTDNLIYKAAELLRSLVGQPKLSARIRVDKKIPMGAGLGGGSSNAATCLVALNKLWKLGLHKQNLAQLGLELGADVPIFIYGQTAWAEGVGERIQAIEVPPRLFVVLSPACHVSTEEVFSHEQLCRDTAPLTLSLLSLAENASLDWHSIESAWRSKLLHNDCEAVVYNSYPEVNKAAQWLGQYGPCQLTGTGACLFLALEDTVEGRRLAQKIQQETPAPWQSIVTRSLSQSPLRALLN